MSHLLPTLLALLKLAVAVRNQGELGTCSLYAFTTCIEEMVQVMYDVSVDPERLTTKLIDLAEANTPPLDLFAGSTAKDLSDLQNRNFASRMEDRDRKKTLQLGIVRVVLKDFPQLVTVLDRMPGPTSAYVSIKNGRHAHAVAAARLWSGERAISISGSGSSDVGNLNPNLNLTVRAKNSHGGAHIWVNVTRENFITANLIIPVLFDVRTMDTANQKMVSHGAPLFSQEFEAYRRRFMQHDQRPFPGGVAPFDVIKAWKVDGLSPGTPGVVTARSQKEEHVKAQFFVRGQAQVSRDVNVSHLVPAPAPLPMEGVDRNLKDSKDSLPGGLAAGDLVRVFSDSAASVSCLDFGVVEKSSSADSLKVHMTSGPSLGQLKTFAAATVKGGHVVKWRSELQHLLDSTFKIGAQVMSLVPRFGWIGKNGQRRDLQPGDSGKVTCYRLAAAEEVHPHVDFGDVDGSLPAEDLVIADTDLYDAKMSETLAGGFRRGQAIQVTRGKHVGQHGLVNGPHAEVSSYLKVALHSQAAQSFSVIAVPSDDLADSGHGDL